MRDSSLPPAPFQLNIDAVDKYLAHKPSDLVDPEFSTPQDLYRFFWALKQKIKKNDPLPSADRIDAAKHAFLDSIQGNMLSPHGRPYNELVFFRFEGSAQDMRTFIRQANAKVTSALTQYQHAKHRALAPDNPFASFALTKDGIIAAGCRMPRESNEAFSQGMLRRHGRLLDEKWRETPLAKEGSIHGAWLLGRSCPKLLKELRDEVLAIGGKQVHEVMSEKAVILRNAANEAVEPFGFRDGVSMPEFFREGRLPRGLTNMPLENVLLDCNEERGGSFLVYRKLQQHVDAFRGFEGELAKKLKAVGQPHADAGRLVVGRERDGTPLANRHPSAAGDLNAFDFSKATDSRCPYHAHIRKAHPRTQLDRVARKHDLELNTQFVRRGVIYGTGGNTRYDPTILPTEETGLLFLAYMSDISKQFETMQANWLSHAESDAVPGPPLNEPDAILYGARDICPMWSWSGIDVKLQKFVTTVGGSYLFVPPKPWMERPPLALKNGG